MRGLVVVALLGSVADASPRAPLAPIRPAPAFWRALAVDTPGAVRDATLAERAARAYLAAHVGELAPGASAADFRLIGNTAVGDQRAVGFQQLWRGLPIIGAEVGFVFAHDRLFAVSSRAHAHVTAVLPDRAPGHAVLPVAGGYRVVDVDDRGEWTVYRDPRTRGEVARTRNWIDGTSKLVYDAPVRYPSGARGSYAAADADIVVAGTSATTASDGSFTWAGTGSASVTPGLSGPFVSVTNQAGAAATASLVAQPGVDTAWSLASDEVGDAQLSTFIFATLAKARARVINPAAASWLDQTLPFYVNEAGACNAFTTMNDLHFFRASADCENTGRLADLVFHEFGHALHLHSIVPGMGAFDAPLSEGLADFNAANLTEDPNVGRGLYLTPAPVRQIDPYGREPRWPDDIDFDFHVTGEIVSGALWDLRAALIRQTDHDTGRAIAEHVFAGVLAYAADIPSSYMAALVADDDDGNLANGTPHYCAIQRAFGAHGLAGADYQPTLVAPPVVTDNTIAVAVTTPAPGGACPIAHVTSITVAWQPGTAVGGTFQLAPQGDTWTGAFPDVAPGTIVTYTVDAALDDGSHVTLPDNPADPAYQRFVGSAREIWCEHFDAGDPQWAQTGNMGDEWQWGGLFVPPTAHDPPSAHSAPDVWGTHLDSTGLYRANEVTSTSTPTVDVSAYERVHLQYWRWLSVEDATYDQATILLNGQRAWGNVSSRPGTLDHIDREWRFHDLDATPFIGADGTLQVTWSLASDPTNQFGGWTLDDVCFVGVAKRSVCGDHELDDGEECDDGNTTAGDGCSPTCRNEIIAGGGGGCSSSGRGGLLVVLVVLGYARASRSRSSMSRSSSGMLSPRT